MSSGVFLEGSEQRHPNNSVSAGPLAPEQKIEITLVLRRREQLPADEVGCSQLTREQLASTHGADPSDIAAVQAFANEHELAVIGVHNGARCVTLSGPLSTLSQLFEADVELRIVEGKPYRTRQGRLKLPEELASCVIAILGFDQRPVSTARRHIRPHSADALSYTPAEVASLYSFPSGTGKGQTIALIELGGGYRNADLQSYWKQLGLRNVAITPGLCGRRTKQPKWRSR